MMKGMTRPNKNPQKEYFTKEHENAILEYVASTDQKYKNILYKETIRPVLLKLIDKIVNTFKFTNLPNIDFLKEECEEHLIMILPRFDVKKNFKAFAYLSVITKNWFIAKVKKNVIKKKSEINTDDINNTLEGEFLSTYNTYIEDVNAIQFFRSLERELEDWDAIFDKPNEKKVLYAVRCMFRDLEYYDFILNKKGVSLYLREATSLNSKQISNILKKFKKHYLIFRKRWLGQ